MAIVGPRDVGRILKKHHYDEVKTIGEGSFGRAILVKAEDGSLLVCKMVNVSQASAKETQDAVKEGRLLAAFRHPFIVQYRENFIDNGWLCILMAYCEGGDLTAQIELAKKDKKAINEEQVLRWITQAFLALKYIHEKHVLHRDLKSGNFFLSKSGNLKMGDFGIARVLSCTAACAQTQIGTPYYLSPEVCQEKPYAWPSDIWAMGCILYEMCALQVPFNGPNMIALVQKICRGPTPVIPDGYSDFTRQLTYELLNKNPATRPSAENVLQRPRIQSIVRRMFEQAQNAQEPKNSGSSSSAGTYQKGDLVEYYSNTHKDWIAASVVNTDGEGRIIVDVKPNVWISKEAQAQQVRRQGAAVSRANSEAIAAESKDNSRQASPVVPESAVVEEDDEYLQLCEDLGIERTVDPKNKAALKAPQAAASAPTTISDDKQASEVNLERIESAASLTAAELDLLAEVSEEGLDSLNLSGS